MAITQIRGKTSICYFLITIDDKSSYADIPQDFNSSLLSLLRELPRDLFQLSSPTDYFEVSISSNLRFGLDFFIILDIFLLKQSPLDLNSYFEFIQTENHVKVFLIDARCSDLENILDRCKKVNGLWYYSILNGKPTEENEANYFINGRGFVELLIKDVDPINKFLADQGSDYELRFELETNEDLLSLVDLKFFLPAFSNFFMFNQIIGNFWKRDEYAIPIEELFKAKNKSYKSLEIEERPKILLDLVKKIDWVRYLLYQNKITPINAPHNPVYETLILIFPYHNPFLRKEWRRQAENLKEKTLLEIITSEQNNLYQHHTEVSGEIEKVL
ncbi:MAG: hypothetical protein H6559_19210 [Lewinellaceae bacterium]|nr:hypothetical protein [Lewinellaceae bacterium]